MKHLPINTSYTLTERQAIEWQNTSEKYTFCVDVLEISASSKDADEKVNALEDHYRTILLNLNLLNEF